MNTSLHNFLHTAACRAVSRQWLGTHVPAATGTHATIELLLETVFSTRSVQRIYKEDNWVNRVSSVWESVKKRIQLEESRNSMRT
jgi:hypothetical protein